MTDFAPNGNETVTAALLQELLGEAGRIAAEAHDLLAPMGQARDELRHGLLERGLIVPIGDPHPQPLSIAAVDGGSVREPLYVADLMVVVATSAEGMTSTGGHEHMQDHWARIVTHTSENDRLLSCAMASYELALLNRLGHDLRILDGSTTSHILTLWGGLGSRGADIRERITDLITDEVLQSMWSLGKVEDRVNTGRIVAMAKSDSSHHFMDLYSRLLGVDLPGGDRFMAAQILNPGEMLYPRRAVEHASVGGFIPKEYAEDVAEIAQTVQRATSPIRDAVKNRELVVTYLKPETADTVLKAELLVPEPLPDPRETDLSGAALDEVRAVARYLSDETPGPHMQEPFAQYAVDLAAKSVSVGANALNQAMLAALPEGAESYLPLLTRSYRTQASSGPSRPGGGVPRPGGGGGW